MDVIQLAQRQLAAGTGQPRDQERPLARADVQRHAQSPQLRLDALRLRALGPNLE